MKIVLYALDSYFITTSRLRGFQVRTDIWKRFEQQHQKKSGINPIFTFVSASHQKAAATLPQMLSIGAHVTSNPLTTCLDSRPPPDIHFLSYCRVIQDKLHIQPPT